MSSFNTVYLTRGFSNPFLLPRKHDYENFLALLLIKDAKLKQYAFAIRAVNVELARVHDVTTESKIAEMRMKFWEDAVDRIYGDSENKTIPDHPVVKQLKIVR